MGEIRENVKRNLGYYLSLRGISQKELAEKLNVSQSAVTNWIKGKNSPDIEIVAQICIVLDVSVVDLFGAGDNSITPQVEQATSTFKKLNPEFQKYALDQVQKLLELQDQNNKKEME